MRKTGRKFYSCDPKPSRVLWVGSSPSRSQVWSGQVRVRGRGSGTTTGPRLPRDVAGVPRTGSGRCETLV